MIRKAILLSVLFLSCKSDSNKDFARVPTPEIRFELSMVKDTVQIASDPISEVKLKEEDLLYGPFSLTSLADDHFVLHDLSKKTIHLLDSEGHLKDLKHEEGYGSFFSVIQVVSLEENKLGLLVDKGDRILIFDRDFVFLDEIFLEDRCKSFSAIETGLILRPVDPTVANGQFLFKILKWDGPTEIIHTPSLPIKIPVQEINFKRHDAGFVSYKESFNECIYMIKDDKMDSLICFDFGEFMPDINLLSEDDASVQRALVNGFLRIIDYDFYEGVHVAIISFEQIDMIPKYFAVIRVEKTGTNRFYAFNSKQVPLPHDTPGKIVVMDFDLFWKNGILRLLQIDLSEI